MWPGPRGTQSSKGFPLGRWGRWHPGPSSWDGQPEGSGDHSKGSAGETEEQPTVRVQVRHRLLHYLPHCPGYGLCLWPISLSGQAPGGGPCLDTCPTPRHYIAPAAAYLPQLLLQPLLLLLPLLPLLLPLLPPLLPLLPPLLPPPPLQIPDNECQAGESHWPWKARNCTGMEERLLGLLKMGG